MARALHVRESVCACKTLYSQFSLICAFTHPELHTPRLPESGETALKSVECVCVCVVKPALQPLPKECVSTGVTFLTLQNTRHHDVTVFK